MDTRGLFLKLPPAVDTSAAVGAAQRAAADLEQGANDRADTAKVVRDRLLLNGPMDELLKADARLQAARADLERIDAMRKCLSAGGGKLASGYVTTTERVAAGSLCM